MAAPAPSQVLRRQLDEVVPRLFRAYQRIVGHLQVADIYPEYLLLLHTVIRASVPLMEDVVELSRSRAPGDNVVDGLVGYLEHHIPEERGHDEWLLDDLAELGVDRPQALRRLPSPTVAAMVGAQYYWIRHHHPVALLGYIAVLEGYPASPADIEDLARRTGLPRVAFRMLELHARLDPGHHQELDALLDALPLTDDHLRAVCTSGIATVHYATTAFTELLAVETTATAGTAATV